MIDDVKIFLYLSDDQTDRVSTYIFKHSLKYE